MSLNSIVLKPQLLADLFGGTLVETVATSVPEKKTAQYLGNNKKQILVAVKHLSVPYLPDNELNFLTTILAACKLGLGDIAIINQSTTDPGTIEALMEEESKIVLLFDVTPASIGLPIHFPNFQVQHFNKRIYLCCPALGEIEKDTTMKKQLWNSLKTVFSL